MLSQISFHPPAVFSPKLRPDLVIPTGESTASALCQFPHSLLPCHLSSPAERSRLETCRRVRSWPSVVEATGLPPHPPAKTRTKKKHMAVTRAVLPKRFTAGCGWRALFGRAREGGLARTTRVTTLHAPLDPPTSPLRADSNQRHIREAHAPARPRTYTR